MLKVVSGWNVKFLGSWFGGVGRLWVGVRDVFFGDQRNFSYRSLCT